MTTFTPAEAADTDIAIVGMAGHFPGAPTPDELWRRVEAAEDCLVDLTRDELRAAGVSSRELDDPDYIRRNGVLDDVDMFDPGFFGIGKRDAAIMDPQHRHFMECCWEALETSGHVPERFVGAIGIFGGCGMNTYMLNNLLTNPQLVEQVGMFLLRHTANDKDFLSTTVSYRLDLRGPSVNVQTACSTSLVAVHLAVQSLLAFECDLALAGGSTIEVPHRVGYRYHEGEILSPDGHCRAFDERSAGTVLTSGAGVVALRRLADALEDRDPILAVVKATAINNDGTRKVGYLAPSVDGHADVVREALAVANLSGRDIQLLEAHGTGTAVGDPIEVAALTEAFRGTTADDGFCRLVSTKPNIGHLDTAAGVASLIKVVQALQHRTLPPIANHTAPSPLLDIERTPFTLSAEPAPWPGDRPRRAGISSLGVGGTNAHAIVQEAPAVEPALRSDGEQLLAFSARDTEVLDAYGEVLAAALAANPDLDLADVAATLARRRIHGHRRVVAASDAAGAAAALRAKDRNRVATTVAADEPPKVVFMFPGGGSQYVGMAAGLDARFDVFHDVMRDGIARVKARSGVDLAPLLRPGADEDALRETTASLPAVFLTSLALARQWMAWGVEPGAIVGHSLGEYVAAHLAGVLTLDGALDLVVARSRLMGEASSGGAMLAVPLSEGVVGERLPASLSLATINAVDECVVAGPAADVAAFQERLATDDITATRIPLTAAAHSSLLDPVLPAFLEVVRGVPLAPPRTPYLSNLTGTWITAEQATNPQYWVDHLRGTVRFADGLATVLADGPCVLVELGPGHSLSSYARRQESKPVAAIPSLRHPNQDMDDTAAALVAFGRLWSAGVDVDVARFAGPDRRTVRLPGYPFKRERYWIEPGAGRAIETPVPEQPSATTIERITDVANMFWAPRWREQPIATPVVSPVGPWVVVGAPTDPFVAALARALTARGDAVDVTPAPHPAALQAARSVVLVGPTATFDGAVERWLSTASAAARALGEVDGAPTLLAAITRSATDADGPADHPADAMALGVIGTAPREYQDLRTVLVDLAPGGDPVRDAASAVEELVGGSDLVVAHRGLRRLVPSLDHVRLPAAAPDAVTIRHGGTYLVTGALGGVGHVIARHLAAAHAANLVVVASRPVPSGAQRDAWIARHGYDDATSRRIRRLAELEALGTKVTVVAADLADPGSVRRALDQATSEAGHIDGAFHAAGELRDRPIELATAEDHNAVVGAKARGALTLCDELSRRGAELLVLTSSTSTVLLAEGQAAYVAANSVLDSLAGRRGGVRVVTVNFGLWGEVGIAATLAHRARLGIGPGDPIDHPVLSELAVERDGTIRAVGTITAEHHWVVDEHRSASGVAVLPGTGHIELMLATLRHGGLAEAGLRDVIVVEPLAVPEGVPVAVRVTVRGTDVGASIELESDGGGGSWRTHSEGALALGPGADAEPVALTAPAGSGPVDPLAQPSRGLELGPRWHTVVDAWRNGETAGGRLALPAAALGDADAWIAHPALVDVATAFGVALGDRDDALYVPVGYAAVASRGQLPPEVVVSARRRAGSSDDLLVVDLAVAGPDGTPLLTIDELNLRPIADAAALAVPEPATPGAAPAHHVPALAALAEQHGIRAAEGADILERLLASGQPRLVASSLSIEDLVLVREPDEPDPADAPGAGSDVAHAASALGAIRGMWVELLGVADIGDDDDFFDVGGHSLIAIRLMSRIHKELGVRFQLSTLFEAPTIAALAAKVLEARPDLDAELAAAAASSAAVLVPEAGAAPAVAIVETVKPAHRSLVTISTAGDKAPLFVVHGAGGNVLFLWSLARALAGSRPIYGFQAHGVDGSDMPDPTVEAMAARYVDELRAAHAGPYLIGGYSGGGTVAYEMVRQLQALGDEVSYLVLFDSAPPGRTMPNRRQVARNVLENARRIGWRRVEPFAKDYAKYQISRFIPARQGSVEARESDERELGLRDVESLGFVNLWWYFTAASEKYDMGEPVAVAVGLLKAGETWPGQPYDYHWTPHVRGPIDIVEVPGNHDSMVLPENAPRLADVLAPLLDAHEP